MRTLVEMAVTEARCTRTCCTDRVSGVFAVFVWLPGVSQPLKNINRGAKANNASANKTGDLRCRLSCFLGVVMLCVADIVASSSALFTIRELSVLEALRSATSISGITDRAVATVPHPLLLIPEHSEYRACSPWLP